jgi:RNA polymerase sigma factor (sigma-70 family)
MCNEHSSTDEFLKYLQIYCSQESWENSEKVWGYLNARYMSPFIHYARERRLSYHDAEEVANETLEQIVLSIDQYNGTRGNGWIWTIHKNKVTDWLRRKGFVQCEELKETYFSPDRDSSPEFHLEQKEQWQVFLRAWKRLPCWAQEKLQPGKPGRKGKQWEQAIELLKRLMREEEEKNDVA